MSNLGQTRLSALPSRHGLSGLGHPDDPAERAAIRAAAASRASVPLTEAELGTLGVLTDETAAAGCLGVPATVPRGLPVD